MVTRYHFLSYFFFRHVFQYCVNTKVRPKHHFKIFRHLIYIGQSNCNRIVRTLKEIKIHIKIECKSDCVTNTCPFDLSEQQMQNRLEIKQKITSCDSTFYLHSISILKRKLYKYNINWHHCCFFLIMAVFCYCIVLLLF